MRATHGRVPECSPHGLHRWSLRQAVITVSGDSWVAPEAISQLTVTAALRVDPVNARVLALAAPSRMQDVPARMGREPKREPTSDLAFEVAEREASRR